MKLAIKRQTVLEKGHTDHSKARNQTLLVVFVSFGTKIHLNY